MKAALDTAIRTSESAPFYLLEVGSWAGHSACLWAEGIKARGTEGVVVCVDAWAPYDASSAAAVPPGMRRPLETGEIFRLFLHNIQAAGHQDIVTPFRGYTDQVLPALRDASFHLAYVDGSHAYGQVLRDLHHCARLVREGGILCGDDLERQLHEVDPAAAEAARESDYVQDPGSGEWYHPGVTLAVAEFFGCPVSCADGFWLMRRGASGWGPVALDPAGAKHAGEKRV